MAQQQSGGSLGQSISPGVTLKKALLVPLYAVPFSILGAIVALVPGYLLDDRLFGEHDDRQGLAILAVAVLGGAITFVTASVVIAGQVASRLGLNGRRKRTAVAGWAGWIPLTMTTLWVVALVAGRGGLGILALPAAAAAIGAVLAATAFALGGGGRRMWSSLAAGAAVIGLCMAAGLLGETGHRADIYTEAGTQLGLVSQTRLNEALPGWSIVRYEEKHAIDFSTEAKVVLLTETNLEVVVGFETLEMYCRAEREDCQAMDPLVDGSAIWSTTHGGNCLDGSPAVLEVMTAKSEGRWVATSEDGRCEGRDNLPTVDDLRLALSTIDETPPEPWLKATQ